MREILFRGKRVDNGEWVEGFFYWGDYRCGTYIIEYNEECINEEQEVHPETVGQFAGLLDKNGKRIFEGDVLKCISPNDGHEFISDFIASLANGITFKSLDLHRDMIMYDYEWMEIEIIGNIHDSPINLPPDHNE